MTYLSEVRLFIVTTVGLLIIVASCGLIIALRFSDSASELFWTKATVTHQLLQQSFSDDTAGALEWRNYVEGYILIDAEGKVVQALPEGAESYFNTFRTSLQPLPVPGRFPRPVTETQGNTPMAFISSMDDGSTFLTYHANPLITLRRSLLIYFGILCMVAIGMPVLTFFFLTRRITRPFTSLVSEAEQSPLAPKAPPDSPEYILHTLQATIRELKQRSESEKDRADALHILATTLAKNLPSGLIVLDRDGRVIRLSPVACDVLKLQMPTDPIFLKNLLAEWPALCGQILEVHETGEPKHREEIRDSDTLFAATIVPLYDENEGHFGTIVLFVDRTPMVIMEEHLRKQKNLAELGVFASGIAHEFRNSIAAVQGYMNLYAKKQESRHLDEMRDEISHILNVTNRFLDFSRDQILEKEVLDLSRFVNGIAARVRQAYPKMTLTVKTQEIKISFDPTLMEQALRNVLDNSCQVSDRVDVVLNGTEESVFIDVLDDGPGIPEDILDQVCLPFVSGRTDGVGLGLAVAARIIVGHGGKITHELPEQGGTLCRIELPRE